MPPARRRKKRTKKNRHLLFILLLIIAGVFLYFEEFDRDKTPKQPPAKKVLKPATIEPKIVIPDIPPPKGLPKVAIIMDDLGSNKQTAYEVLNINSPLTIAILPHLAYSSWVAEQANSRGRDIILHLPMEATRPLKLGKGGLHLWMTDEEITKTLVSDLNSVPFIKGVSNHMGSGFTQDERGMKVVLSELKKRGLFFLDSITTSKSIAYDTAEKEGVQALRRDVFLDDSDDPDEIKKQWDRLILIAAKNGHAIAQGHPRRNTLDFLRQALKNNDQVIIVPVTELFRP